MDGFGDGSRFGVGRETVTQEPAIAANKAMLAPGE